jgi:predicted nucleic-acid-binding protein
VIGLDTNILVRYIMQDDIKQSPLATRIVESLTADSPGFLPLVAVVELAWVFSSAYELSRSQLIEAFEALLRTKELVVERGESVWKGLRLLQANRRRLCRLPDRLLSRGSRMRKDHDLRSRRGEEWQYDARILNRSE